MKSSIVWTDKVQNANGVDQPIYDVIYTLDGTKIVAAAGPEILIYKAATSSEAGELIKALKAHKDTVLCLSPLLGNGFASGGADKQVIIWNSNFQGILKFSHNESIQSISQNPITGVVLSCSYGDFGLWTPDVKAVPKQKVQSRIVSSAWSPDGQQFALGLFNGHISIRSSSGEEQLRIERGNSPVWSLAWSPSPSRTANFIVVADWAQRISFFESGGRQIGKDRMINFDPCCVSYFGEGGEYMLIGGSDKEVHLWTADGLQMGKISSGESWIWACRAKPREPYVVTGSADGTIAVHQVQFNTVQSLQSDRYASRQNLTDVVVQNLISNQTSRVKCRDFIQKISIYKEWLAVQLPNRIFLYESFYDEHGEILYRLKEKIPWKKDCFFLVVASSHILICSDKKLDMISHSGESIHEWTFDSTIRCIKILGGAKGKEGVLIGLKDGQAQKLFLDNPFPVALIHHKFPIKSLDLSMTRKKLSIVDDENTCSLYDLSSKQLITQEPDTFSACWNAEVEESICFSGPGGIMVKTDNYLAYQQKLIGTVAGFKGSRVFSLSNYSLTTLEIPQTVPLEGYLERSDFESAFKVACFGVPEADWRKLGVTAMEQLNLGVAKKAFSRIRDFKFLEAIRVIEKMKQDGQRENDLFQAEVSAYSENYQEAAKLFKRSGNIQKAIEMYTELNMWELATRLAEEIHEDTHDILKKKAQMQQDRKEVLEAAATYEQVGEFAQAIELLGSGGYFEQLIQLVRKLKGDESSLLSKCVEYFKQNGNKEYSLETMVKMNDIPGILQHYVDLQNWDMAFKIGEEHPEFAEQVYLPYGHFLSVNDKFEEAQIYYTKANRPDEAIRTLKLLADHAIIQERYSLAGYYYWCLSKSSLLAMVKRSKITQRDEGMSHHQAWSEYYELAELYYAYEMVFTYIMDPFTMSTPSSLLKAAKFVLNKCANKPSQKGISKVYAYYCLAKIASQVGCYKMSRSAYEKLTTMRLPATWQDTVDLAAWTVKFKPAQDAPEYHTVCAQCSASNPPMQQYEIGCGSCFEPFVHSFYSFEDLPLIRFAPAPDIPEGEIDLLIQAEPPIDESSSAVPDEFSNQVENLGRSIAPSSSTKQGTKWQSIQLNRKQLANLEPQKVFIREWKSKEIPREYYLLKSDDTFVVLCKECQHFFQEEEWNYQILLEGCCSFCKTKGEMAG